jgi:hypothetical protein
MTTDTWIDGSANWRDERKRAPGVADLQNDRARPHLPQQGGEAVAHDRMIVDHQQFHALEYGAPKRRRTRGPKSRQAVGGPKTVLGLQSNLRRGKKTSSFELALLFRRRFPQVFCARP